MKTKFLVISYDTDEQQAFWDWVLATSERKADEWISKYRPYAIVVDCLSVSTLRGIVVSSPSDDQVVRDSMTKLRKEFKESNG